MKPAPKTRRRAPQKQILIVDDHPMMREGVALLISREKDLAVCGEADTASSAVEKVAQLKPDLVIVDITLPGRSGLELIKDIQAMHSGTLLLVVSMHEESLYAERVLRAGARGYVMKQEGGKKLLEAIRQVLNGQIYVSPSMSARILEVFSGHRPEAADSPVAGLTDREFEVFRLIGQGANTRDIAKNLRLSVKTVEVHRLNIKAKLKLSTASELVHYAVRWMQAQVPGSV
jgi:DNA-binding NarL/FixJ family response regulator